MSTIDTDTMSRDDAINYIAADRTLLRRLHVGHRRQLEEMDDETLATHITRAANVLLERGDDDAAKVLDACADELACAQ